jgi:hypothetical protein
MRLEDELNLPAVIRPVQQRLPLSRPAKQIAWLAVPFDPKEKMSGATHHQSRRSHATAAALSAGICP